MNSLHSFYTFMLQYTIYSNKLVRCFQECFCQKRIREKKKVKSLKNQQKKFENIGKRENGGNEGEKEEERRS